MTPLKDAGSGVGVELHGEVAGVAGGLENVNVSTEEDLKGRGLPYLPSVLAVGVELYQKPTYLR